LLELLVEPAEQLAMGLGDVFDMGAGGRKLLRALPDFAIQLLEELVEARWLAG
jgi:hypothetical protein